MNHYKDFLAASLAGDLNIVQDNGLYNIMTKDTKFGLPSLIDQENPESWINEIDSKIIKNLQTNTSWIMPSEYTLTTCHKDLLGTISNTL